MATIIDGVLQFSGIQFRQELFDIKSIQVVKGPQGAIYGRNATGGAIIINTKNPTEETRSYVTVGNGDHILFRRLCGWRHDEGLAYGQISARYIDREGYLDNITRSEKADASKT